MPRSGGNSATADHVDTIDVVFPLTGARRARVGLIVDRQHYDEVVLGALSSARVSVWLATANVKETMVEAPIGTVARAKNRYLSICERFTDLVRRDVEIRLLHSGTPSRPFRAALAKSGLGSPGFEMRQCPRTHMKMIAVDGAYLYLGSANLTGAGVGGKGEGRRNFEMGIATDDDLLLDQAQARFEHIWTGGSCGACRRRSDCPAPLDG